MSDSFYDEIGFMPATEDDIKKNGGYLDIDGVVIRGTSVLTNLKENKTIIPTEIVSRNQIK